MLDQSQDGFRSRFEPKDAQMSSQNDPKTTPKAPKIITKIEHNFDVIFGANLRVDSRGLRARGRPDRRREAGGSL